MMRRIECAFDQLNLRICALASNQMHLETRFQYDVRLIVRTHDRILVARNIHRRRNQNLRLKTGTIENDQSEIK